MEEVPAERVKSGSAGREGSGKGKLVGDVVGEHTREQMEGKVVEAMVDVSSEEGGV